MRTRQSLQVTIGLLLTCFAGIASANLIENGTFDTDLNGWEQTGALATTWDNETAHVGRPGTPGTAIFSQDFDLGSGGDHLKIWFDYQWQVNAPANTPDEFTVELDYLNISNVLVTTQLLFENSNDGAFNQTTPAHAVVNLDNHQAGNDVGQLRFTLVEYNSNNWDSNPTRQRPGQAGAGAL